MSFNPIGWFEIYVNDMDRATKFYEEVLKIKLEDMAMPGEDDGMQMKAFPGDYDKPGSTGALVKMKDAMVGPGGTLVYFVCEDCSVEESRVEAAGGKICQNKMSIGEHGFISIISDTEGNVIGLHSMQ